MLHRGRWLANKQRMSAGEAGRGYTGTVVCLCGWSDGVKHHMRA